MRGYVAVTDPGWLRQLAAQEATEANFWQPRPSALSQDRGTPWIFKLRGTNLIGGFAFLSYYTIMPSGVAWETFGRANGVASYSEMLRRLSGLRHGTANDDRVGCVVLSGMELLSEASYIEAPRDWKANTVRGQYYDLSVGEGARMWNQLTTVFSPLLSARAAQYVPGGYGRPATYFPRVGQGAFRLMVMDAYERRCAITGDRTLPALDAAHIRPFHETERHEIRNGILMRSDLHRLFDQGYVTVTPGLEFLVSSQIRDQFDNGAIYYDLHGRSVKVPTRADEQPDSEALAWHSSSIFRG